MIYTKTIKGKSRKVTITDTAQTIADLIGEAIDNDTKRVQISYIDDITGASPIAWVTEDEDATLAVDDGEAIYEGARITVTKGNFSSFKILRNSAPNFDMWLKQLDSEGQTL